LKIAFDTSLLRSYSLKDALSKLAEIGYANVEIGLAHYLSFEATEEDTRDAKQVLKDSGMRLVALIAIFPVSYADEEVRQIGVKQYVNAISQAKSLDCNMLAAELMGEPENFESCSRAFKKSMKELVPILEKENVTLCYEAHPGDFVELNDKAVDIIKEINSPNLRYLYCASHSFILGKDPVEMIEHARDVLGYVHIADSLRPEKTFFSGRYFPKVRPHQHLTPGTGDVEVKKIISALHNVGYQGYLTINPFSMFTAPLEAARDSKIMVERMMNSI